MNMNCKDCCYFWKEEDEERAYCHWESRCPDDKAPCEYDDTDYAPCEYDDTDYTEE